MVVGVAESPVAVLLQDRQLPLKIYCVVSHLEENCKRGTEEENEQPARGEKKIEYQKTE